MNIKGQEFHSILEHVFGEVNGVGVSEQLQANCPRCQERDGLSHPDGKFSLEINTAKRQFHCWRCDEPKFSGSLGKLMRLYGSHSDYEIYKSYAGAFSEYYFDGEYEEEPEYQAVELPAEIIYFSQMDASNKEHFEAYNYLINTRRLTRETILKHRLGFCITGKYQRRIIIPSYDEHGDVNYFVARTFGVSSKKNPPYDNPKSNKFDIIFNDGMVNWDSTIYLVEGAFDMLSVPNGIPLLGKVLSQLLFSKLKEIKPEIIILLDPDAYSNAIDLFYQIQSIYIGCEERVKIVKLPNELDIDELRRVQGMDDVISSLRTARGLTVDDYFTRKLQKPYDKNYRTTNRRDAHSKYFEWKPRS